MAALYVPYSSQRMGALRLAMMALVVAGGTAAPASGAVFANPTPITIPDSGAATPYGTWVSVAGMTGLVSRVGVELIGAQHEFVHDVRMLLVSPAGRAMVLNRQGGT